jgi:hypothetical protein
MKRLWIGSECILWEDKIQKFEADLDYSIVLAERLLLAERRKIKGGFIKDEYCSWVQYKSGPGGGPSM